ncbi:VOC family protein [Sphingomonas hengshuiensis]|uniref:Bleomycin resistance protein n=1 Tax=Sphingomonas hengshuiensis TaxID=1609977 RepID=A0A7U5BFH0_9SPHN|nr:VOC family protein [Sphingomonas hengshuiensis]AJP74307.1 bleomycin resistance protein [Sphingomonas hengshuiensis]
MARISYVELPAANVVATRDFYAAAFGFAFTDYGPDYASMTTGDVDIGINGTEDQAIALPLPIVEVADLEGALEKVVAAGGTLTVPIFAFPGGRRFHFRDPGGNQLGVFVNEPE